MHSIRLALLALAYAGLIAYGSLFPLDPWVHPGVGLLDFLAVPGERLIFTDILLNILVYMPLGLLLVAALRRHLGTLAALITALLLGATLSLTMEILQNFLPGRVSSIMDLGTNILGTALGGALAATLHPDTRIGHGLWRWRDDLFRPDTLGNLGLLALGLWGLSQLSPLAPSLDIGNLRQGLAPLALVLSGEQSLDPAHALAYALNLSGLGILAALIARPGTPAKRLFLLAVLVVLALKVVVVSRQLSAEALTGFAAATLILLFLHPLPRRAAATIAAGLILAGFAVSALPGTGDPEALLRNFNWMPFKGYVANIKGLAGIVENLWPFFAIGLLVRLCVPERRGGIVLIGGALLVASLVFAVEWRQQFQPGRYPDITDVLLALMGWLSAWWPTAPRSAPRSKHRLLPARGISGPAITLAFATAALAAVVAFATLVPESKPDPQAAAYPLLPEPDLLPPVDLPGFLSIHPRFPAPSAVDIRRLQTENRRYLEQARKRARGGDGPLETVILMAFIEPGSQDLARLHQRLMALEVSWRGHQQAKPLALAYDWLHDQWQPEQRAQLREKLADAGDYLVERIRTERLSAYNVYLYNSPFQALVAVALALYKDDPRGEPIMRFTYDLWKHRVLPVWRQVMGRHGGWHEGGEYVGIGIGQAVYQVPALWRHVTGEDLFRTEPGLCGFLDFLVYRTRPDSTHFRWGDAGHFNRAVPDQAALAIECRHSAAYTPVAPRRPTPQSWPWGPLGDPSLVDDRARERLPWARLFDGLGLLVARRDWTPEATYVTFKAGDNFWSHSHLDQGAFTIYRGGALAIDSGLYGSGYGGDHHMNYTYQTIAHNTITVTDPADTVPAPPHRRRGNEPRPIANDGGQRRVGSGWGLGPAPIDLDEWMHFRDMYHTGEIRHLVMNDELVIVAADITAAYTNRDSGTGDFSARTKRVERLWRTFVYDRVDDVIIVYDQVASTRPEFRKRWLLHSQEAPLISGNRFEIAVRPQEREGRQGGRLTGHVMLPLDAHITSLGGPGFEFFVDGTNYDEDGRVQEIARTRRKDAEPGAWRIEVSPLRESTKDLFLVVMLPTNWAERPTHQVTMIGSEEDPGVEVFGEKRRVRWQFSRDELGGRAEIVEGDGSSGTALVEW